MPLRSRKKNNIKHLGHAIRAPERVIASLESLGFELERQEVLFHEVSDKIDPSLEWLLEKKKHLRWVEGPPVLPETYTVRVKTSDSAKWISYLGHNHSYRLGKGPYKPVVLAQKRDRVLLGTSHGVILTDPERSRHAWIYIFPGGAKLRWPSIKSARIEGETAIVQLEKDPSGGQRNAYVRINLNNGEMF